jgi:UDP-3-O-[3-hydroxymyristoyl] glucosamine N-acyltransferase
MDFTAEQIAALVQGHVEGDAQATVNNFGKIEEATEGQLSFLANKKYEDFLYTTRASVVIINESFSLRQPVGATLIRVPDAYSAFAALLSKYQEMMTLQMTGIQQPSYISPSARIGQNVFIGAFSYIGDHVSIGDNTKIFPQVFIGESAAVGENCILHPGVKVYNQCRLANKVIVHAGTIIGSDGFGFAPKPDGTYSKVPQIGNVIIEDDVEIGSNTTIDRATMGSTIIRRGAKLDNLIQVAHNVEIGENTVIAAQAGVSGSTKVGKNVLIGGQAGIVGHIQLGDGSKVNAQSGVSKSVEPGKAVTGSPAFDYTSALRSQAAARKLPELEKRVKELEAILEQLSVRK